MHLDGKCNLYFVMIESNKSATLIVYIAITPFQSERFRDQLYVLLPFEEGLRISGGITRFSGGGGMDGEISRHLQSIKGEGGELKKIDCQFTVDEGGSDEKYYTAFWAISQNLL